jgi:hypothetical protein
MVSHLTVLMGGGPASTRVRFTAWSCRELNRGEWSSHHYPIIEMRFT